MLYRYFVRTFTAPSSRFLMKSRGLGASFSNHSTVAPLSTTEHALKDEKYSGTSEHACFTSITETLSSVTGSEPVATHNGQVKVTFKLHDGKRIETEAKVGDSLLDVVVNNDLNIEGYGACEGTLTCSTCHVILKQEDYDRLPEEPCDEERDMLDLAYGLSDTSRLGCQIIMTKELDGLEVQVPETINDVRS